MSRPDAVAILGGIVGRDMARRPFELETIDSLSLRVASHQACAPEMGKRPTDRRRTHRGSDVGDEAERLTRSVQRSQDPRRVFGSHEVCRPGPAHPPQSV